VYYGQFRNKITFYPVTEGTCVNTKNWYREETDMWAEFGRIAPFGRRFSSNHSVEASTVGSTSLFSRRTVPQVKAESIRECMMTWIGYKERDELMTGTSRHDAIVLILGNKCCYRGRLGVVLEPGYKYKPLVFVIGIEQFHNKPAQCQLSSPSSRVVEFFERSHRSVNLCKYRQPCIMSIIMRWI
jgi:hypothetical protein